MSVPTGEASRRCLGISLIACLLVFLPPADPLWVSRVGLHVAGWQGSTFRGCPCPFPSDFDFPALSRLLDEIPSRFR